MKCPNCGFEVEEQMQFCGKCGTAVELDKDSDTTQGLSDELIEAEQKVENTETLDSIKKKEKRALIVAAVLIIAIILGMAIAPYTEDIIKFIGLKEKRSNPKTGEQIMEDIKKTDPVFVNNDLEIINFKIKNRNTAAEDEGDYDILECTVEAKNDVFMYQASYEIRYHLIENKWELDEEFRIIDYGAVEVYQELSEYDINKIILGYEKKLVKIESIEEDTSSHMLVAAGEAGTGYLVNCSVSKEEEFITRYFSIELFVYFDCQYSQWAGYIDWDTTNNRWVHNSFKGKEYEWGHYDWEYHEEAFLGEWVVDYREGDKYEYCWLNIQDIDLKNNTFTGQYNCNSKVGVELSTGVVSGTFSLDWRVCTEIYDYGSLRDGEFCMILDSDGIQCVDHQAERYSEDKRSTYSSELLELIPD